MKLITFLFAVLVGLFTISTRMTIIAESIDGFRSDASFLEKLAATKTRHPLQSLLSETETRSSPSALKYLRSSQEFKGCIDPSEPFQCPKSQKCIPLQFICDGNANDCPENYDEKEETCIAAKRPAKENLEKFFQSEFVLHGSKFFSFLFGKKVAKSIQDNSVFWFDLLASALSVSKNLHQFAKKLHLTPNDVTHFKTVLETIHQGRLEDIPLFAQEAVSQGLASMVEKLYESGFMDSSN